MAGRSSPHKVLGLFSLTMINVAAMASLRTLPSMAEYGLSTLFYYLVVAVIFLIPIALVTAELATTWPERGGIYVWVSEALGPCMGFLAIWLQWIQNIIWYPLVLTFGAAALAYVFDPSLSLNKYYMAVAVIVLYWGATLINIIGLKLSAKITSAGVIVGMIVPVFFLIIVAACWFFMGEPINIHLTDTSFFPHLEHLGTLVLAIGILLTTMKGLEMSAVHAGEVKNPQRDYPKAILYSILITILIAILGTLAILIILPIGKINIVSGFMQAMVDYFTQYNMSWFIPVLSLMIAFGTFGQITTWIPGPSKGLLVVAEKGYLPPYFQKLNKKGIHVRILIVQALIVTVLSLIFVFALTVSSSYVILSILIAQLYFAMYFLMFVSAIRLRYLKPNKERAYKIPGKNIGMWFVAGLGILGSVFAFAVAYVPPAHIVKSRHFFYEAMLISSFVILSVPPLIIYTLRRPSWKQLK